MLAPSAIAALAVVLSQILRLAGVNVVNEDVTTTLATLIAVIGGLVVYFRQVKSGASTIYGTRPKK